MAGSNALALPSRIPASCGARAVIQSNRPLPIIPVAFDAAGQPFSPQNVEHPAVDVAGTGVELRGREGARPPRSSQPGMAPS